MSGWKAGADNGVGGAVVRRWVVPAAAIRVRLSGREKFPFKAAGTLMCTRASLFLDPVRRSESRYLMMRVVNGVRGRGREEVGAAMRERVEGGGEAA